MKSDILLRMWRDVKGRSKTRKRKTKRCHTGWHSLPVRGNGSCIKPTPLIGQGWSIRGMPAKQSIRGHGTHLMLWSTFFSKSLPPCIWIWVGIISLQLQLPTLRDDGPRSQLQWRHEGWGMKSRLLRRPSSGSQNLR